MDSPPPSATPTDIELTAVNKLDSATQQQQKGNVQIAFSTHVGWDGVSVIFFSLGIAGLFVYITVLYTKGFQAWHRPWVWLFVVTALLYFLLIVNFLWRWKLMAILFTEQAQTKRNEKKLDALKRTSSAIERAKMTARNTITLYEKFKMNGPWFLWKLHVSELLESVQQCANLVNVYLCTLPTAWTAPLCLGLTVECAHTAVTMVSKNTTARRNRQVMLDVVVDFLCIAGPLCVVWFVYQVPISIPEMVSVTLVPALSMLGKLDDIFEECVRYRSAMQVANEQTEHAAKAKRRRESLFEASVHVEIANSQEETVPLTLRKAAALCKALFGLFFLVVAIAQLAQRPTGCDEKIWGNGCVLKVPFCKSLFTPTCNCASLKMANDNTLTVLPNSMVDEMAALRKVFIRNCNLTTLPPQMERLTEMVDFEVSFNRLKRFDVDVRKWKKLNKLHLMYNEISSVKEVVWKHPELSGLGLGNNNLTLPPASNVYMPSLTFLHIGDNNMTISYAIGATMFPVLTYLYMNGNRITRFPKEDLNDGLLQLGISRCELHSLPLYLSTFKKLQYLDARDNHLRKVTDELRNLLLQNNAESYFSGNRELCSTENALDCEPICSETCYSKKVLGDGVCDIRCNTGDCHFDGGDCKFRYKL